MSSKVRRAKRKGDRRSKGHDRKRLLRSDEPAINVDAVSSQLENLLREQQRLSDSQLDAHVPDVKRDAIASIMLHADARIPVDIDTVFPREVFPNGPMDHLVEGDGDLPTMRYLDVMVVAAYSHCTRKYGQTFTSMSIIYETFHNMMSMSWEESTEMDTTPSVLNMKRLFFFTVLTAERGFEEAVANDYRTVEALARYTRFVQTLRGHTERLFQTPYATATTASNHVGVVLNNYIHHVMQESILAIQ